MYDQCFRVNGSDTNLTLSGYKDWFTRNNRVGTLRQSVMEYCVGKTFNGLESPCGSLYRVDAGDGLLTGDGISILLRSSSWYGSDFPSVRSDILFRLCISHVPDVVIFGLHDMRDHWHPVLDLDAWDFYSVPGKRIASVCEGAAYITMPALLMLGPVMSDFNGIKQAVDRCVEAEP